MVQFMKIEKFLSNFALVVDFPFKLSENQSTR